MWKPSKNPKVEELTKSYRDRSYNLSCLLAIKLPELNAKGKNRRMCAWCTESELFHGNQKYCSQECSNSAMAWAYPQKENALLFLLQKQDWKCASCQFDYKAMVDYILAEEKRRSPTLNPGLFWYHMKRLKDKIAPERKPEVDHIVPISRGGESLGLFNHQAICYTCHKTKTKVDNSGPRRKKNE